MTTAAERVAAAFSAAHAAQANQPKSRMADEDFLADCNDQEDGPDEYVGCECEQDWTCGPCKAAGRFGGYTWIETRYDGIYDPDERY